MFTELCAVEIDFATYAMFSHFTIKHGTHVLSCINHIIVCLLQTNPIKYVNRGGWGYSDRFLVYTF